MTVEGRLASDIIREEAIAHGVSRDTLLGTAKHDKLVALRIKIAQRLAAERGLQVGTIGRLLRRSAWQVGYYLKDDYRERRKAKERNRKRALKRANSRRSIATEVHYAP